MTAFPDTDEVIRNTRLQTYICNHPQVAEWTGTVATSAEHGDGYEWQWARLGRGSDVHTCPMYMEYFGRLADAPEVEVREPKGSR
eukprot:2173167-Heterocapsa_arctica.AAC.1